MPNTLWLHLNQCLIMTHQCDSYQPAAPQKVFRGTVSRILKYLIIRALSFFHTNRDVFIYIL